MNIIMRKKAENTEIEFLERDNSLNWFLSLVNLLDDIESIESIDSKELKEKTYFNNSFLTVLADEIEPENRPLNLFASNLCNKEVRGDVLICKIIEDETIEAGFDIVGFNSIEEAKLYLNKYKEEK